MPWLIDLEKDPNELTNYYSEASYKSVVSKLTVELKEWLTLTNDPGLEDPDLVRWLE